MTEAAMNIDYIHFYVEDAQQLQNWLVQAWGFQLLANCSTEETLTYRVGSPTIQFLISSPRSHQSPVAAYLQAHPPGVADLAFRVTHLKTVLDRAMQAGVRVLQPIQPDQTQTNWRWCAQIQGWGDLRHTLIESTSIQASAVADALAFSPVFGNPAADWVGVDHVVLNVAQGDLEQASAWYETCLGFQRQQNFAIQTEYSGLCSRVLSHPEGQVQLPINEPACSTSQIQEFLDWNQGSGIQHIALRTPHIVSLIARLRQQGIRFLSVPETYYEALCQRTGFPLSDAEYQAIAEQVVLVDWQPDQPEALLLQAFTQPIFAQPTFFFELIERRTYQVNQQILTTRGFGERNFQALFEAIEREQLKRGSLKGESPSFDAHEPHPSLSASPNPLP